MLEDLNNLLKKIFSNEETLVFAILLVIAFFNSILFGKYSHSIFNKYYFCIFISRLQKRLENLGLSSNLSLIFTYGLFLLMGITLILWLAPLVYQQTQSLILEIPKWVNSSMVLFKISLKNILI